MPEDRVTVMELVRRQHDGVDLVCGGVIVLELVHGSMTIGERFRKSSNVNWLSPSLGLRYFILGIILIFDKNVIHR